MFAIAAIGLLTIVLSLIMIVSPAGWSRGILLFSRKPYFHVTEVFSRFLMGGVLVFFASQTLYPLFIATVGYIFLAVGVLLIAIGARNHRAFAVRSASFVPLFRPAGVVSLGFGAFVIYTALG